MRKLLSILSALAFLSLALLPHLHLVVEGHAIEAAAHAGDCSGQHEETPHPEHDEAPAHDHDSCSLCKLLASASDIAKDAPALEPALSRILFTAGAAPVLTASRPRAFDARAPPFVTA